MKTITTFEVYVYSNGVRLWLFDSIRAADRFVCSLNVGPGTYRIKLCSPEGSQTAYTIIKERNTITRTI